MQPTNLAKLQTQTYDHKM